MITRYFDTIAINVLNFEEKLQDIVLSYTNSVFRPVVKQITTAQLLFYKLPSTNY